MVLPEDSICRKIERGDNIRLFHVSGVYDKDKERGHIGGDRYIYLALDSEGISDFAVGPEFDKVLYETELPADRLLIDPEPWEFTQSEDLREAMGDDSSRCASEMLMRVADSRVRSGLPYDELDKVFIPLAQTACLCDQVGEEYFIKNTWVRLPADGGIPMDQLKQTPMQMSDEQVHEQVARLVKDVEDDIDFWSSVADNKRMQGCAPQSVKNRADAAYDKIVEDRQIFDRQFFGFRTVDYRIDHFSKDASKLIKEIATIMELPLCEETGR